MFRRLTSRRTLKWTGTVACVLLAAVFVASRWYHAQFGFALGTHGIDVGVERGFVQVADLDLRHWFEPWALLRNSSRPHFGRAFDSQFDFWPRVRLHIATGIAFRWGFVIPLWIPFIVIAILTAWLWRLDRRRPRAGCCRKCDYDLTGNVSGRCPECGAATGA